MNKSLSTIAFVFGALAVSTIGCSSESGSGSPGPGPSGASQSQEQHIALMLNSSAAATSGLARSSYLTTEVACASGRMVVDVEASSSSIVYDACTFDGDLFLEGSASQSGDASGGSVTLDISLSQDSTGIEASVVGAMTYAISGSEVTLGFDSYQVVTPTVTMNASGALTMDAAGNLTGDMTYVFEGEYSGTVICSFSGPVYSEEDVLAACSL